MTISKIDPAGLDVGQIGGRRNLIINGAMQVAQRSTSETGITSNGYHTLDRWRLTASGATLNTSRQEFTLGQTDVPSQFKYFQRLEVTTGNDNADTEQRIEDVTTVTGDVVLSFYAKGTNPGGGTLDVRLRQFFGSGGSSDVDVADSITLTANWQRFSIPFTLGSLSGKTVGAGSFIRVMFGQFDDTSTDAWTLDITGVQLEVGTVATPFEHRSYGEELALCQRYFISYGRTGELQFNNGAILSSRCYSSFQFPTAMRTAPSASYGGNWRIVTASSTQTSINPDEFFGPSYLTGRVRFPTGSHTDGQAAIVSLDDATTYLELSAEL